MNKFIKIVSIIALSSLFVGTSFAADTFYDVSVKTGNVKNAGTDAKIYITLYGDNGRKSRRFKLDTPNYNDNERNRLDRHTFRVPYSLGNIRKIYVDNTYIDDDDGPGWFLDYIRVRNVETGRSWVFECGRWLASDSKTKRVIYAGQRCR